MKNPSNSRLGPARALAYGILTAVALAVGCGEDPTPLSQPGDPSRSRLDAPFAVFSGSELWIDALETRVPAPVTVGSTASPNTIRSESPDIVSVDATGALVAHADGEAILRASGGGAVLRVRVRSAPEIEVRPTLIVLQTGGEARVEAFALGDSKPLPADKLAWGTTSPQIVDVRDGMLRAGMPGEASVRARFGRATAVAKVFVEGAPPKLSVHPRDPTIRRGELVTLRVASERGVPRVTWESRNERVVALVGEDVFEGRARGETEVCAQVWSIEQCTKVRVR